MSTVSAASPAVNPGNTSYHPLALPVQEGALAYGQQNFDTLRRTGAFHSDRSRFIRQLDKTQGVVFLRPPRFGKTVFLSMLERYYDIRFEDRFDEFFGGMDIHRDDTRDKTRQGGSHVLHIALLGFLGNNADAEFRGCVNSAITTFLRYHPDVLHASDYDKAVDFINKDSFVGSLKRVNEVVGARLGGRLVVLVDEYDRAPMANLMATEGSPDVEGHDTAKGLVRMFLSELKDISRDGADYFVTGITPMSMDGESIFNTATYLTFEPVFSSRTEGCWHRKGKSLPLAVQLYRSKKPEEKFPRSSNAILRSADYLWA
jgi:hypothetical protein